VSSIGSPDRGPVPLAGAVAIGAVPDPGAPAEPPPLTAGSGPARPPPLDPPIGGSPGAVDPRAGVGVTAVGVVVGADGGAGVTAVGVVVGADGDAGRVVGATLDPGRVVGGVVAGAVTGEAELDGTGAVLTRTGPVVAPGAAATSKVSASGRSSEVPSGPISSATIA
jgi:hypothetical protein